MKIVKNGGGTWHNLHGTYSQQIVDCYDLVNETTGSGLEIYNDTTKGIMGLLQESIDSGVPIKPLGGNWSLSPIASTPGIVVNTKLLNARFPISKTSVVPEFTGSSDKLCFAQCGCSIWELNDYLRGRNQSLSACGASNGQTIAGAMATGTHGAAICFGAIQDSAVGIHLIVSPVKNIYLERASQPVMSAGFAAKLGAELVRDDEAFNAAVTGLGAFGFVHGIMIQTEDLFLLEAYLRRVPFDDAFKHQLSTLDFKYTGLPYPDETPFHFQSLINPYDMNNGVYMTTMYKRPYHADYLPPKPNGEGIGPGDDAPCFIGKLSTSLPVLVPVLVNKVLGASLKPYEKVMGTLGEIFNNTTLRGKIASTAIGFPATEILKVIDLLMSINKSDGPFTGLFAFRFVKKSKATMAFTRFDPTCVLELDGVQSDATQAFYEAIWNAMDTSGIPYTFHWGKMHNMSPDRLKKMYGTALDQFTTARDKIMDGPTLSALSNEALKTWGIDGGKNPEGTVLV